MSPEKIEAALKRATEMRSMYVTEGYALAEIGQRYGVTRERARQIINRTFGVTHKDSRRIAERLEREAEERMSGLTNAAKKRGMTVEELLQWREMYRAEIESGLTHYKTAEWGYIDFRRNARHHTGTPTDLTRMDWFRLWQESGHYAERGRKLGQYVMGRIDRTKGFVKGNLIVRSVHDNSVAERVFKSEETRARWEAKGKLKNEIEHRL